MVTPMQTDRSGRWGRRAPGSLVVLALVAAGLVGSDAAAATTAPTFSRTDHQQLGNNHVVADFNGDGRPDVAGQGAQSVAVLLNQGGGGFGARVEYPVADWTQDLAAADFDRDGRLDLAVTINSPQTSLSLLMGNGDGTFAAAVSVPNTTGLDSPAVVATDLNHDLAPDLLVAHAIACFTAPCVSGTTMSVLLGNGDGTFQPAREVEVGRGMAKIAVADFDRDGHKDLAIGGDSSRLYLLRGLGDGTFTQQPTITLTADTFGVNGTDVDVGDFDRDGLADLVVALPHNGSRTAVLIGNGDGTFRPPLILTDPGQRFPQFQAVADYNGDGFQDLAITLGDGTAGLMQVRNGNGDGTFQSPVLYLAPPPKSSLGGFAIEAADLNGDAVPDLTLGVVGAAPSFAVLLTSTGTAPPPTPGTPTLLSPASGSSPAQPVTLDWADAAGASRYRVQVDDSSTLAAPFVVDQLVTPSQLTLPTLSVRRHWWRVRGVSLAGVAGPWSTVRRFTPQAVASAPALASITLNPATVVGGNAAQGTAALSAPAPAGGAVVVLSSSSPAATVPASVTVTAGASTAVFPVSTVAVGTSTAATITGSYGGATRSAALTVTPAGEPTPTATLTVTATGRSGERVTSSPAGINVAVGGTGSTPFAVGTSVTLSVSNGRDAVWSGACSSGGNKARTCTFTVGGNAAVTANVQ